MSGLVYVGSKYLRILTPANSKGSLAVRCEKVGDQKLRNLLVIECILYHIKVFFTNVVFADAVKNARKVAFFMLQ